MTHKSGIFNGLGVVDWLVLGGYLSATLLVGIYFAKRASKSTDSFLIADRKLPWWVIGFANVASYSDAGGAWVWIFFFGGFMFLNKVAWITWPVWMPLVCVFWAKFWRRSRMVTTGQLIEFRYSGKGASYLRGFFAAHTCLVWGVVLLGYGASMTSQILAPLVGWDILTITVVFGGITLTYTLMSGLFGAVYNDVVQFFVFFSVSFVILYFGIQEFGSYHAIVSKAFENRHADFFQVFPPSTGTNKHVDMVTLVSLLVLGLFMAGSPVAGEGWTAQRFLAAKNERHAVLGQMFNCVLSLVVRMVPLIPLGLLAIATFPASNPFVPDTFILPNKDTAPAIEVWGRLTAIHAGKAPGLVGLLLAAVLAGYMSSVSTLLQWGASLVTNDLYHRHIRPQASERECVWLTRLVMIVMMILATCLALGIKSIGTWVLFINTVMVVPTLPLAWLRWFWWRTNVWAEAFALIVSAPLACLIWFVYEIREPFWLPTAILFGTGLFGSIVLSLWLGPEHKDTLKRFYLQVRPPGWWGPISRELATDGSIDSGQQQREFRWDLVSALGGIVFCFAISYAMFLFAVLRWSDAFGTSLVALVSGCFFYFSWMRSYRIAGSYTSREDDASATAVK